MSIRVADSIIAGGGMPINKSGMTLFDFKFSDHLQEDISWLRADTFNWQDGNVYKLAYQHLLEEWNASDTIVQSETINGIGISWRRAKDGHKIIPVDYEAQVAQIFDRTGVAWYYILDIPNKRFKLPRTTFGVTGIRGEAGDYVEPGLPNITGYASSVKQLYANDNLSYTDGCLYSAGSMGRPSNSVIDVVTAGNTSTVPSVMGLDASRSSAIYGSSNTVQPAATEMYLYFYVGEFTQTAQYNTAGLNADLFNNKADDSSVVHKTGTETINGSKTFTGTIFTQRSTWSGTETASTSDQMLIAHKMLDDAGDDVGELSVKRCGNIGRLRTCLYVHNPKTQYWTELAICSYDDGTQFATCPTPNSAVSGNEIITASWARSHGAIIAKQDPTSGNGWSWYRKYGDGWVVQGRHKTWNGAWTAESLVVKMQNANYATVGSGYRTDGANYQGFVCFKDKTTTNFNIWFSDDNTSNAGSVDWVAFGYAG